MNYIDSKYFDNINFDEKLLKLSNFMDLEDVKTVYGYLIYSSFQHVLSNFNDSEKSGKMILKENPWITVSEFLTKIQWGLNIKLQELKESITQLFHIFVTQGYMACENDNGQEQFNLSYEPEVVSSNIIEKLYQKHRHLIYAIDDIMPKLQLYCKFGKKFLDKDSSNIGLLWESLHLDPIHYYYISENMTWNKNQFSDTTKNNVITVANLTVGSGIDTREIISKLVQINDNVKIIIFCFDTSPVLLKRGKDNLTIFKRQIGYELHEKNIELQFHFSQFSLEESIGIPESSIDLLIANYFLHFIPQAQRENIFHQMASLLKNDSLFLMSQFVSISKTEPHPITPLFLPFKNFHGVPTIIEVKELAKKHFKDVKNTYMGTNWHFRKPRK